MDWSYIWILLYVEGSQDGEDIKGNNLQNTIKPVHLSTNEHSILPLKNTLFSYYFPILFAI